MAIRYSGDIEVRITCKPYVGWNGKRRLFYFASIAAPGHRGQGILSPEECGVRGEKRSSEAYDAAARAFILLADKKVGIGRFANWDGPAPEILRVQQAPCPVHIFDSGKKQKTLRLGDAIKKATGALGIRSCTGCERRRKALNKLF
jgi:hypothetical protein